MFSRDRTMIDGFSCRCKDCRKRYYKDSNQYLKAREKYRADPEKAKEKARQYRLAHPDRAKEYRDRRYNEHRQECLQESANTRQRYRDEAFVAYGGYICACCGETIRQFLTIDHMDGTPKEARNKQRSGWLFYQQLKSQGYPPGYQVLCYNCNCGRARNNGICPHKLPP